VRRQILNLNFHGIGHPIGRDFGEGEREFWVTKETFERTLDIARNRNDVALSFDDGNSCDVDLVLPALQQRELTATFFIVPGWLGEPGFMTKADVKTLASSGMTIGNHGLQHHCWTELERHALEHELSAARQLLEELTDTTVDTLAIPYGVYNDAVLDTLRTTGSRRVFTSDGGAAPAGAWLQPREHLRAQHTPADVERLVDSAL
jgi:peptidoglycan/xylan/chitin deacetylase (PgdA/CDA1 family)